MCEIYLLDIRGFFRQLKSGKLYQFQKIIQQPQTLVGWAKKITHPNIYDATLLPTLEYK